MAARRVLAEVVIEADDAVDFGARQIQPGSNARHGLARDVAELLLDAVQDGQQRPRLVGMSGHDPIDRSQSLCIKICHEASISDARCNVASGGRLS